MVLYPKIVYLNRSKRASIPIKVLVCRKGSTSESDATTKKPEMCLRKQLSNMMAVLITACSSWCTKWVTSMVRAGDARIISG